MPFVTKNELSTVFQDTMRMCKENSFLRDAVASTNAHVRVYTEDFAEEVRVIKDGKIRVEDGRTFQKAIKLHKEFPGKKIAVLNFAASGTPGGGVQGGSYAQEESLCRCSTLYPSLMSKTAYEEFYGYHREHCDWKASDRCIYSPDVIICKDDRDLIPETLRTEEFVKADVVTCAAPHLFWDVRIRAEEQFDIHVRRAKNILRCAAYNGADIFVSGAFGCGAFHNDPCIVAWAWREALKEYREKFDLIDFVIYISDFPAKKASGETNFISFRNEFSEWL